LPGGHLEDNETLQEGAARELNEEVGIEVKPDDLELFHVYQNRNTPGRQYIGFIFRAKKWSGTHQDREEKVRGAEFFNLDDLPSKLISYHRETLRYIDDPAIQTTFIQLESFDPSGQ
jgi:ADP-ribose pyrophosphatase YjhB (NUDIX family)